MTHGLGRDGWPSDETVIKTRDAEIESLKKNISECTAAFLRLKEVVRANHEFRLRSDPSTSGDFSKGFYKGSGAYVMNEAALALALPDDSTEVLDKYTKPLNDQQISAQALTIKTMREAVSRGYIALIYKIGGSYKDGYGGSRQDKEATNAMYEALALPDNSTEILQEWFDKKLGEPVVYGYRYTESGPIYWNPASIVINGASPIETIAAYCKPEIK